MANNMVFNRVASQLQATVTATAFDIRALSGATDSVTVTATAFDIRALSGATDSVTVTATAFDIRALSGATDSITVTATDLDIRPLTSADVVTVTATAFDIRALSGATDSITVTATDLDIRPLTSADVVTVTATAFDIRALSGTTDSVTVTATDLDIRDLSGATDSVKVSSYLFTEDSTSIDGVTDAAAILAKDTSEQGIYSYYVTNTGTNSIDLKLQISPTTTDTYFVDDISGTVTVAAGQKAVLVAQQYLKYTRLYYDTSGATCTFEAHYNARV
ncbi:DUF6385 domain-containing protein [Tepidibacter mesophilus]|uniref:DUF6385 domain-containing protein n=1 Tax=Tepidibacter mesophilus TaxID=655607 RepID=UPI0011AFC303|nr:DUF6385 domain-containing protein [Tepidibacter mesophilus]